MNTTIAISKETKDILQNFGKKSETYDDVIRRMFNIVQMQKKIKEFVDESGYSTLEEAEEWTRLKLKAMAK
ncbi:hypothetical protein ACFL0V_02000 [Nanoarchaeota archaeon]